MTKINEKCDIVPDTLEYADCTMDRNEQLEVWMRGPIPGIPALLQPVAHALLQAKEEVTRYMEGVNDLLLWQRPGGVASIGFHLQHMAGVIDRMFTYAEGRPLSEIQLAYLYAEGKETKSGGTQQLVNAFSERVDAAVQELSQVDESTLTNVRYLGRKQIPTTRMGLLFHAAEHTQRHVGQLLVTIRFLKADE